MTTVVVPFVEGMLSPETRRVVTLSGYHYRLCSLDRNDEGAYARLIRHLWRWPCDLVIVEHDVEPTIGQLEEICECGHDWCGFNYDDGLYPDGPMFGCVRFSDRLIRRQCHRADDRLIVGKRKDQDCPWWQVDTQMAQGLMIAGERWIAHDSRVHHVHAGAPSGPA